MNAKEIIGLSILAQELPPSMLDYQGKRDGLDFIRIRDHVVFRSSVITGHAGYRVYRGPEQKPWWWR